MADETRELARLAGDFKYEQIPATIRGRAIDLLVDQIGIQIGCSDMPWAKQVREVYRRPGGSPEATVVLYGDKLPITAATIINSTFGHSFEYDDANPLVHGHIGAELIPSLLAVGESKHISGKEFLTALVAAYEVRGHIGWAISPSIFEKGGPQYSTTCGPFGVAAGVAKLLGMDTEGIRNALGVAGTFSGGLMQYDHGGGSVKRLFTAIGASSGIQAAYLAKEGITGPEGILEGARGLLKIYPTDYQPERLIKDFGKKWMIDHLMFKPYSCCGLIHPAIEGLATITSKNSLKVEDIKEVEVGYPKCFVDHAAITDPKDLLGMQFSSSFTLAISLLKGRNTPREYTMEVLNDPAIRATASKVKLWEDSSLDQYFEGHMPARVRVTSTSGKKFEELVIDAKGSPGAPLSSDEVDEKFRSQVVDVFGKEKCEKVLSALRSVDSIGDVATILKMLTR